jgi:hypothetical protein
MSIFHEMLGKVMVSVTETGDTMTFKDEEGKTYSFSHIWDCCESVRIEDICGDLSDLEGSPILLAEMVFEEGPELPHWESYTWSFYKFATVKGSVTVRWLGTSNGYYSETVDYFVNGKLTAHG